MVTEKQLIRLEDALAAATHDDFTEPSPYDLVLLATVRKALRRLPTVDAVEVVHGRWRIIDFKGNVECSECGHTMDLEYNYCPNCGADMRERKDNG